MYEVARDMAICKMLFIRQDMACAVAWTTGAMARGKILRSCEALCWQKDIFVS